MSFEHFNSARGTEFYLTLINLNIESHVARGHPYWTARVQQESSCKILENIKCPTHVMYALELLSNFPCTAVLYFPACLPIFLGFPFLTTEATASALK